uniref:Uncharacterized protein n=1 Tax=Arundo donax TaxID=35708 RepID=A0A0A9GPU1_ARUDO
MHNHQETLPLLVLHKITSFPLDSLSMVQEVNKIALQLQ